MADYESRIVRGWRGRMDDALTSARERVWGTPASTVYFKGVEGVTSDNLGGHRAWFKCTYGPERATASAELQELQRARAKTMRREARTSQRKKVTREEKLERLRVWFRQWRAKQTAEWRRAEAIKKRLRVQARPDIYKVIERRTLDKNRDTINARKRMAYQTNLSTSRARHNAYRLDHGERLNALARGRAALAKLAKP